jgi:hypothetical protein
MNKSQLQNLILEAYAEVVSELNEAPDGLYYIKVEKWNKALLNAVQNTIETIYHPTRFTDIVDDDGAGNVIMYFPKEDFDPGMIDDLEGEGVDISRDTNLPRGLNESMLDEVEDEEPTPEEQPDNEAPEETVLEDATDTILAKFPTLKSAIIKLQTEDFKEFVTTIDWISPRPTSFRINLKNGQDYILKWTGKTFEAQILGKRYVLSNIAEYQQALDKLAILYKEAPMKGAGEEGGGDAPADFGSSGGGGGADFPGEEGGAEGGEDFAADDAGGDEGGGEDLSGEPIDFEDGEEG